MVRKKMFPSQEKLFFDSNDLIRSSCVTGSLFGGGWHFHQEYELVLITKSYGTSLIGDDVSSYSENDLYLTGINLPHTWICDKKVNRSGAEAFVLHFKPELFSISFLAQPEFILLRELLQRSESGIRFPKKTGEEIRPLFEKLLKRRGIDRVIFILEILDACSREKNYTLLASEGFAPVYLPSSDEKLQKIISFIEVNYPKDIRLEEIAAMANMQTNAFCRYFKRKTNFSLVDFINRVRVGNACRLLLQGDLLVQEIGYRSGFNSNSYFITQFRLKTGKTPKAYRVFYRDKLFRDGE